MELEASSVEGQLLDVVGALPGEVGSLVLGYLGGRDLLTCALVGSWSWHGLARHRLLWKSLTLAHTRRKQRAAVRLLHLRLLGGFNHTQHQHNERKNGDGGGLSEETWEWKEWARSYFEASREADRARLRDGEELAAHRWRFTFRPEAIVASQAQPPPGHQFFPQFYADGRYQHPSLFSAPLAWRFIDMPDYDGKEGRRLVQIHRFPALRVRRTEDWGWVLENDFVLFESEDPELERKRQKREQRLKQRIAALSHEELAALSTLSEQDLCAKLLEWRIDIGGHDDRRLWPSADIVAAVVARVEDVREELRAQEAAKHEQLECARRSQENFVK